MRLYDPRIDGGEWSVVLRWADPEEQTKERRGFHRAVRDYADGDQRSIPLAQSAAAIFGYRSAILGQTTLDVVRRVA